MLLLAGLLPTSQTHDILHYTLQRVSVCLSHSKPTQRIYTPQLGFILLSPLSCIILAYKTNNNPEPNRFRILLLPLPSYLNETPPNLSFTVVLEAVRVKYWPMANDRKPLQGKYMSLAVEQQQQQLKNKVLLMR